MDVRAKTFAAEAGRRFGFLAIDYEFNGPEVTGSADAYPLTRTLRYSRGGLAVEISLVLAYMGEEYVATLVTREDGAGHPGMRSAAAPRIPDTRWGAPSITRPRPHSPSLRRLLQVTDAQNYLSRD